MTTECFIPKSFYASSRLVIRRALEIIHDPENAGYKLTLRQIYYQFVSRNWLKNEQNAYKRLGEILNDARLAGVVPWDAIEDRTRTLRETPMWGDPGDPVSPAEFIADWGRHFKNNPWNNQPKYVLGMIEKDSLVGILERPCQKWRVPFFSCRGYVSASEMYDMAQMLEAVVENGQEVIVLHLGDHDPSGVQMSENIAERLDLLSHHCRGITVRRIALNMDQIKAYNPPANPAKETDSRYKAYCRRYNTKSSWELDSMPPSVMAQLVEDHIVPQIDMEQWDQDIEKEKEPRRQLMRLGEIWDERGSNFYDDMIEAFEDLDFKREED